MMTKVYEFESAARKLTISSCFTKQQGSAGSMKNTAGASRCDHTEEER